MLAVSRRVIWQHGNVSAGRWRGNGPAPMMYEIFDKTLYTLLFKQHKRWSNGLYYLLLH